MPQASGAGGKQPYWLADKIRYDEQTPPTQNVDYEVLSAEPNVRLLIYAVRQQNDEQAAKDIQVTWTLDGHPHFVTFSALHNTQYYVYVNKYKGDNELIALTATVTEYNCAKYCDKRALEATLRAMITSVVGTNQTLTQWLKYEQLEETTV